MSQKWTMFLIGIALGAVVYYVYMSSTAKGQ